MPDPFGLKAGSTPPAGMANYLVSFYAVPKPHPAFVEYSGTWTPEAGLTQILASSPAVSDQADCATSRALYERVKRQLSQVYGDPHELEFIDTNQATWTDEGDFWNSLNSGERSHSARWSSDDGHKLDSGINEINLMVVPDGNYDSSRVMLSYQFEGFEPNELADEYGLDSL